MRGRRGPGDANSASSRVPRAFSRGQAISIGTPPQGFALGNPTGLRSGSARRVACLIAATIAALVVESTTFALAQTRPAPARRPATPAPPAIVIEPAQMACPQILGEGVSTKRVFCDVSIGRDPAEGIRIALPPHTGPVTLLFDLHNRHTYSEEMVKAGRAYHRYTATIGVLTLDNTLVSRAIVQNEFRDASNLVDRVGGGGGPGGLKAVAPTGTESLEILLPAEATEVSILGEKLTVIRADGVDDFKASGRPIALVSNVLVSFQPPPPARPARAPAPRRR
jgi:hypothetical protein